MEHDDLTDDLAAGCAPRGPRRPASTATPSTAALLARVRQQPIAARRAVPRAVRCRIAAGVIVVATAAVVLGGIPGNLGGPPSAAAITQETLRWLDPPSGTVLHVRSVETTGGSDDDARVLAVGGRSRARNASSWRERARYETSGDALYDPATEHHLRRADGARGRRPGFE